MLIGGRVVAGLGTSGILNGAMLIVAECAPMQKRPGQFILLGLVNYCSANYSHSPHWDRHGP